MIPVAEQLKDFCDCLPDDLAKPDNETFFERNVLETINLISILTCWTNEPCETFLNSERTEYIDLEEFNRCTCDGGIVEFTPHYLPFQPDTFKVYLIEQEGITEEVIELDATDYSYGDAFGVLRIDVRKYVTGVDCGCKKKRKLKITYDAGYELIPECLLQLFCDLLHVVYDKNNCDCSACQSCSSSDDVEIEYLQGDDVSPKLSAYLDLLVQGGYKKQLGLISLCGNRKEIWGVVV